MRPAFVPWWILILTAAIFVGLAVVNLIDGPRWAALVWLAFAALSVRVALVNRKRLAAMERDWLQ